ATPRSPALARSRSRRASTPPRKKSSLLPCPARSVDRQRMYLAGHQIPAKHLRPADQPRPTASPNPPIPKDFGSVTPALASLLPWTAAMTEGRMILGRRAAVRRLIDRIE